MQIGRILRRGGFRETIESLAEPLFGGLQSLLADFPA
jgi:hypothetical protein